MAGTLIVEKIVGAAAEQGRDLAACRRWAKRVNGRTRSMGVALTSCTVPAAGKPTFDIGDDEMEMGVGIHGEPGRRRVALSPADEIAEEMGEAIVGDLAPRRAARRSLLVNGFGGTPLMELYLDVPRRAASLARRRHARRALAGRQLRDLAGDGRLLDHRLHADAMS